MARISKPNKYSVSAGVAPSAVPDGAGSVVMTSEPVAAIAEPAAVATQNSTSATAAVEPVAPSPAQQILEFVDGAKGAVDRAGVLHAECERLSRLAAQVGDHANHGKLARIGNVIADFRNGLIAVLS